MRIFTTRRETEIILSALYGKMEKLPINEMPEYHKLTCRIIEILEKQCKDDRSKYEELENVS